MSETLRSSDFNKNISGKSQETPSFIETKLVSNFEKGLISEELFLNSMNVLEKGKKGTVGEIRDWSGKKYQKTATGWVPVKESGQSKKSDEDGKGASIGKTKLPFLTSGVPPRFLPKGEWVSSEDFKVSPGGGWALLFKKGEKVKSNGHGWIQSSADGKTWKTNRPSIKGVDDFEFSRYGSDIDKRNMWNAFSKNLK